MNDIQIFNNPDFGTIRTVMIDDEPWFVGKDIAQALGYGDGNKNSKALTNSISDHVDTDDKQLLPYSEFKSTQNGDLKNISHYGATVINESGLYSLIFGSKLESAKKFKKWVTSEVLPSIRKTGSYNAPPMTIPEQIQLLAQGNVELNKRMDDMQTEIQSIKLDLPILPIEADKITVAVKKKGVTVMGGKQSNAYNNRGLRQKVYNNLYSNLKYNFGVTSYKQIKRSECDKAISVIENYQPPFFLQQEIEAENAQQRIDF